MDKKPDPFTELRIRMLDLEAQGVPNEQIIDAALRLAVGAAALLYGPQAAVDSLHDMVALVAVDSPVVETTLH